LNGFPKLPVILIRLDGGLGFWVELHCIFKDDIGAATIDVRGKCAIVPRHVKALVTNLLHIYHTLKNFRKSFQGTVAQDFQTEFFHELIAPGFQESNTRELIIDSNISVKNGQNSKWPKDQEELFGGKNEHKKSCGTVPLNKITLTFEI